MIGRIATDKESLDLLKRVFCVPGRYLEIGTLFGGSLIEIMKARHAKGIFDGASIIDPLNGYYEEGEVDFETNLIPTRKLLVANLEEADLIDHVEIVQAKSAPLFPIEVLRYRFGAVLIDGDHAHPVPTYDWYNVRRVTRHGSIVAFHDAQMKGVMSAIEVARYDPEWEEIDGSTFTAVFKRRPTSHETGIPF